MARKTKKLKLKSRYKEGDFGVLVSTLVLSVFGIIMVYSASYYTALSKTGDPQNYLKNNLMWMAIGWVVFLFLLLIFATLAQSVWWNTLSRLLMM